MFRCGHKQSLPIGSACVVRLLTLDRQESFLSFRGGLGAVVENPRAFGSWPT